MIVEKLKDSFTGIGEVKGFNFKKVFENDKGYVYEVSIDDKITHFEAFYKKETFICLDFKNKLFSDNEKKEIYPK